MTSTPVKKACYVCVGQNQWRGIHLCTQPKLKVTHSGFNLWFKQPRICYFYKPNCFSKMLEKQCFFSYRTTWITGWLVDNDKLLPSQTLNQQTLQTNDYTVNSYIISALKRLHFSCTYSRCQKQFQPTHLVLILMHVFMITQFCLCCT